MDFMIYLHNLGDRESEKPKRHMCNYHQSRVNFENFFFFGHGLIVKPKCAHRCLSFL